MNIKIDTTSLEADLVEMLKIAISSFKELSTVTVTPSEPPSTITFDVLLNGHCRIQGEFTALFAKGNVFSPYPFILATQRISNAYYYLVSELHVGNRYITLDGYVYECTFVGAHAIVLEAVKGVHSI